MFKFMALLLITHQDLRHYPHREPHGWLEQYEFLKDGRMTYSRWSIGYFWLKIRWFWANGGFSRSVLEEVRIRRLMGIDARNGPKQIILAQIANSYWLIGNEKLAVKKFHEAKESETNWGGRLNKDVERYILEYCNYCIWSINAHGTGREKMKVTYRSLKNAQIPEDIKLFKLPLPSSPNGNYIA